MTEPNANDAGELNLEQLETVAGGVVISTLQPTSLSQTAGLSYNKVTGTITPSSVNQGSPGTSAADAISLTLSGTGILSVGTLTMPTTTANPATVIAGLTAGNTTNATTLPNTGSITITQGGVETGGFTIV